MKRNPNANARGSVYNPIWVKYMNRYGYATGILGLLTLCATGQLFPSPDADQGKDLLEERAYALAGYIPQYYLTPVDPFEPSSKEELKKYQDHIASFLKQMGVDAKKIQYIARVNALILTDTRENLDQFEVTLRGYFRPDMQLRALEGAKKALDDKEVFVGDALSRIALLDDMTVRAFHGEVRKLEFELERLPEGHEERMNIEKRLSVAKAYRQSAITLCRDALRRQTELIQKWQRETGGNTGER
jgi:hypothetical protein